MTNENPSITLIKSKPIKQGKLYVSIKGLLTWSWQPLWCILYSPSDSEPSKILMYNLSGTNPPNLKDLKQEVQLYKTSKIDKQVKGRSFTFRINITKKKKVKLSATTSEIRDEWVRVLCETIPCIEEEGTSVSSEIHEGDEGAAIDMQFLDNDVYESAAELSQWQITMKENEDARRIGLKGEYFLSINDFNISLIDKKSERVICYWSYKFIRGFGKSKTCFSLEAGSSSSTGRGFFTFTSNDGEKMFEMARSKLQKMKELHKDSIRKPASGSSSKQNSLERYTATPGQENGSKPQQEDDECLYAEPLKPKKESSKRSQAPAVPSAKRTSTIHDSVRSAAYEEIMIEAPVNSSEEARNVIAPGAYSIASNIEANDMDLEEYSSLEQEENLYDEPDPQLKLGQVKVATRVFAESYDHLDFPTNQNVVNRVPATETDDYAHICEGASNVSVAVDPYNAYETADIKVSTQM